MSAKTVLITGGTGALGGAVTRRFVEDGHRVATTWIIESERDALRSNVATERILLVRADVTDPDSVDAAVSEVEQNLGSVEVLVDLVGAWKGGEQVHEHSLSTWDKMIALNLTSAFLCCRRVLAGMLDQGSGRIVLVSSRTAREGRSGQAAYAVAKAGVAVLAETIAEETRGSNVTANVIAPSTLDTPANRAAMPSADHSSWVAPERVATAIAYLASEAAGDLRGAWLPLYGSA